MSPFQSFIKSFIIICLIASGCSSNRNSVSDNLHAQEEKNNELQTPSEKAKTESNSIVPVLKWRNDLLANMRSEDIKQTIENLPNLDDDMLASTSITVIHGGKRQTILVTRLMRVRKLYAIGQENPDLIIPDLRRIHKDSLKEWPEAFRKFMEDYDNGRAMYSEPDPYMRVKYYCLAATYLLAEFGDYDSLPLLSQQYKIHRVWSPPNLPAPVAPAMTFYAMHRLVSSYPRESLSKEAVKALDEYLEAAEEFIPPPKQIKVTVWDAAYSESDPRLTVLNLKKEVLQGQKAMIMPLYPAEFRDGTKMQNGNTVKSEKMNELFNKLDSFVWIVYSPSENLSLKS